MYPQTGWRPFLNCSVKQFFGTDDPFTGDLVGRYLGATTRAFRAPSSSSSVSVTSGRDNSGSTSISFQDGESVQLVGRPLLTPDEVMALLSSWQGDGWRSSIVSVRGKRPIKSLLVTWKYLPPCPDRLGPLAPEALP
jgi:type IV secretion system protein VirD4